MKVIDLLNKIANGEEVPKKIQYRGYIYELEEGLYYREDGENKTLRSAFNYLYLERCLNDEIEIIEEDKKIEKMIPLNNVSGASDLVAMSQMQWENNLIIERKINEIIDYLEEKE